MVETELSVGGDLDAAGSGVSVEILIGQECRQLQRRFDAVILLGEHQRVGQSGTGPGEHQQPVTVIVAPVSGATGTDGSLTATTYQILIGVRGARDQHREENQHETATCWIWIETNQHSEHLQVVILQNLMILTETGYNIHMGPSKQPNSGWEPDPDPHLPARASPRRSQLMVHG